MKTRRELVIVITVGVGHTSSPASPLPGGGRVGRVSASASSYGGKDLHRMLTSVLSLNVDAVELLASGAHKMHYS
ncbi:hypothetical protein BC826DRAFT_985310 [Russula brevipes]|nr:hypothetical protein BC826DRAFT_985310 [Russula brevipes]